jgi:hypothetical protein
MTAPTEDHRRDVPAYVALARIIAVVGMSAAAALGIFLIVGGWWLPGLIALVVALPWFFAMRFVEKMAEAPETDLPG